MTIIVREGAEFNWNTRWSTDHGDTVTVRIMRVGGRIEEMVHDKIELMLNFLEPVSDGAMHPEGFGPVSWADRYLPQGLRDAIVRHSWR